ncbi:MAG: hypothetical protein ACJ748_08185, partial [Flavisolibacter sp.]
MLKFILIICLIPFTSNSQKILFKNDTLVYQHHKFFIGKDVRIAEGSASEHNFSYIFWGMYDEPANPIGVKWTNT